MIEGRMLITCANNIWTSNQFWQMAQKISHDIIVSMDQSGHPLPKAMHNGIIDISAAAESILESVVANINAEAMPAGNA